ncbi:hypothetical protein [Segatella hominis]|uniref:tetratricopeptide repeat protein n=3 Tax=Segatella hominis TaxID=2518605 RepID=UPI002590BA38|nr:hypothetical protein [Prevotella sp.]
MIKKLNTLFTWILLPILFVSCTGNKAYDKLLIKADSIMNIDDDSAEVAIRMMQSIKPELSQFSKSQKKRYELLYHKAMNKAYIDFTSDSTMLEVVDYYEQHGSANEKMLAYYILGCVYRDMHEAPMALEYYNKATELADTTAKDCDYATLCRIYSQMGFLFAKQHLPHQELASLDKAVKYAYLAKDTLNAIRYYQNKQAIYASQNKLDSAIIINNQAAKLFKQIGALKEANIAFGCNFEYYLKKKMLKEAEEAFKAYLSTNYHGNDNWKDAYAYILYERGSYYLAVGKKDSAYSCLKQSFEQSKSFSNLAASTRGLAQYYAKTSNPVLAAKYALLSSAYNDSDLIATRQGQLQQVQAMYNYNRNKDIAYKAQLKAEQRMSIIYIVIICAILLFIVSISIYRKRLRLRNKRIAMVQKMYNDSVQQLNEAQQELLKLQDLNENTIATLVKEKEETIQKLQMEVKKYEEANIGHNLLELEKQLKQSPIYQQLVYLENHPLEKMTKNDWSNLEETVEKFVYGFADLKQKLNTKEYHICLLVKLHFSPSTISSLIGTSLSDISNSRRRMLAKICGNSGNGKDFDDYIHHIL